MVKERIILTKEEACNECFMAGDIAGILEELNSDAKIVVLFYNYNENLKKEFDEYFADHKSENTVFCTVAYVSTDEFPLDEYHLGNMGDGDKLVPLDEILERDSKVLKECGFIDINNFVNYVSQIAFIYSNELGLQVVEKINEFLSKDNKEEK